MKGTDQYTNTAKWNYILTDCSTYTKENAISFSDMTMIMKLMEPFIIGFTFCHVHHFIFIKNKTYNQTFGIQKNTKNSSELVWLDI